MAHRLILGPIRRSLLVPSLTKTLVLSHQHTLVPQARGYYVSDMRKSAFEANITRLLRNEIQYELERSNPITQMRKLAFEGNILRLLRHEIQYELERSNPDTQPVSTFDSFSIDERPGEQWIKLTKKFGGKEEIKLEATMFDASVPVPKPGGVTTEDDIKLHMTVIVDVFKGEGNDVLEFVCSAWADSIQIQKVYMRRCDQDAGQAYIGPSFKELDDDLQISLYDYLEERGIDDELATFLHAYMKNKAKTEHIRWMGTVKSFVEKK